MSDSNASVRNADLCSTHKYPWKWYLDDLEAVHKNGKTVFSCFSCGGGSSMGYKLAGYEVIGNIEIDQRVMKVYQRNNHPKHSYLMDVRDFSKIPKNEIPRVAYFPKRAEGNVDGEKKRSSEKDKRNKGLMIYFSGSSILLSCYVLK